MKKTLTETCVSMDTGTGKVAVLRLPKRQAARVVDEAPGHGREVEQNNQFKAQFKTHFKTIAPGIYGFTLSSTSKDFTV